MAANPWNDWRRLWRAGQMMNETMSAAQAVVGQRQKTLETAMSDPLGADHAELGRMVTEKAAAFGAAGASLSHDWWAIQRDWHRQVSDMTAMMLGRLPGPRKAQAIVARGQRLGSAALASSVRAMTPIHRTATANEKRLARGKR